MKDGFIYRNPIFISEVKKRLADKRNYRLKTKLIAIDKFPSEESKKNFHLLSNKSSQSNLQYFLNFIKEKGYKSAFTKVGNTFGLNNLEIQKNENTNLIKGIPNIIKLYHQVKNNFCSINKYQYKNYYQRQTPFQINHIKNNYIRRYIRFIRKKNSHDFIENEKNILSFSINSSGQKKKIFGKKRIEFRNTRVINKYLTPNQTSRITLNKVSTCTDFRSKYFCKDFDLSRKSNILKPNCYYNRLNLSKYSLKSERKQ